MDDANNNQEPQLTTTVEIAPPTQIEIDLEPTVEVIPETSPNDESTATEPPPIETFTPPPPTQIDWADEIREPENDDSQSTLVDWSQNQEPVSRNERRPNLRKIPRVNYRVKRPYRAKEAKLDGRTMVFDQMRYCPFTSKAVVNLKSCCPAARKLNKRKKTPIISLDCIYIDESSPSQADIDRSISLRLDKMRISALV